MKTLLYPKTYATVVRVLEMDRIVAIDDDGKQYDLALKNRRGRGHCGCRGFDFNRGTRIKVFTKNGSYRFSRVGS